MRTLIAIAAVAALAACSQETKMEDTEDTGAMTDTAPTAPPPTTISITEADARSQIESQGYTNVTGLMQNPDGTWTATATRDGTNTQVSVGPNGVNVVTAPSTTTPPATTP